MLADCPNCLGYLDSRAACGRCSPPCDSVISHKCNICGFRAITYNGEWDDVTMDNQAPYNHFTPISSLALAAYNSMHMHTNGETIEDWSEVDDSHRRAWIKVVQEIIQGDH